MNRILKMMTCSVTLFVTACIIGRQAVAQSSGDLTGSWTLVSWTVLRSGTPTELLGPHPQGQLIFASDGHYLLVGVRADLPKFASGDRLSGSAEENRKIAQGNVAHFGTYSVDYKGHTIAFRNQRGTFPNCDGEVEQRPFTLIGDRLTYVTPGNFGYGAATVVWQRAK